MILAHEGVKNPEIWKDWERLGHGAIKLLVLPGLERNEPPDGIPTVKIRVLESTWGHKNIAINTLNGFKWVAKHIPEAEIVYLVSGHCIPVQHPCYLLCGLVKLPALHCCPNKWWNPLKSSMPVFHREEGYIETSQWISLNLSMIGAIDSQEALIQEIESCNPHHYPDEYYIQTLVHRANLPFQNVPTTDYCHTEPDSFRPILWEFNEVSRKVYWFKTKGKNVSKHLTAKEALRFAREAGYVFARKYHRNESIATFQQLLHYMRSA